MRVIRHLLGQPITHAERIFVQYAIVDIVQLDRKMMNTETMRSGAGMYPGANCGIESAQSRVVQVTEEIPEQTEVNLRVGRKTELLFERVPQLFF